MPPPEPQGELDEERCNRLVETLMDAITTFYGREIGRDENGQPYVNAPESLSAIGGLAGIILAASPIALRPDMFELLVKTVGVNADIEVNAYQANKRVN